MQKQRMLRDNMNQKDPQTLAEDQPKPESIENAPSVNEEVAKNPDRNGDGVLTNAN